MSINRQIQDKHKPIQTDLRKLSETVHYKCNNTQKNMHYNLEHMTKKAKVN